jgi:hypothetical protein
MVLIAILGRMQTIISKGKTAEGLMEGLFIKCGH